MTLFLRPAILAGALVAASVALAQTAAPAKVADTSKGKTLVDAKGMTLYTFDRDATGKSNCNGTCATELAAPDGGRGCESVGRLEAWSSVMTAR